MDILINKTYKNYGYKSRYLQTPIYFNTVDKKQISGIGSNVYKDAKYISHKVTNGDTLDSLALTYYNNPTLYWVIAYYNDIQDAFCELTEYYTTLKIPYISDIKFGNDR